MHAGFTEPTDKQAALLDYIRRREEAHDPPTVREIMAAFGIRSPNGCACHLRALEKKGLITIKPATARGIRTVPDEPARQLDQLARRWRDLEPATRNLVLSLVSVPGADEPPAPGAVPRDPPHQPVPQGRQVGNVARVVQ